MSPGLCFLCGTTDIQVLSVRESQEWDVIVEPSIEAAFPTMMLVQASKSFASDF
jgi:hypothetical protein